MIETLCRRTRQDRLEKDGLYFVNIQNIRDGPKRYYNAREFKLYAPLKNDAVYFSLISQD
jgi:hypothetical protein